MNQQTFYLTDEQDNLMRPMFFDANWIIPFSMGFGQTSFGLYDFGS